MKKLREQKFIEKYYNIKRNDGKLLTQLGKWGVGNGEFKKPEHVAFNEKDGTGTVYIVDRGNHRIQVFVTC